MKESNCLVRTVHLYAEFAWRKRTVARGYDFETIRTIQEAVPNGRRGHFDGCPDGNLWMRLERLFQ